jgi:hypothetical protein
MSGHIEETQSWHGTKARPKLEGEIANLKDENEELQDQI